MPCRPSAASSASTLTASPRSLYAGISTVKVRLFELELRTWICTSTGGLSCSISIRTRPTCSGAAGKDRVTCGSGGWPRYASVYTTGSPAASPYSLTVTLKSIEPKSATRPLTACGVGKVKSKTSGLAASP